MNSPGVAVIGTGYIGNEHIKAISAHDGARLTVICSTERSKGNAEVLQGQYGAGRVTADYESVLHDDQVDVVIYAPRIRSMWRRR
jgi:predicted dehydrogenase